MQMGIERKTRYLVDRSDIGQMNVSPTRHASSIVSLRPPSIASRVERRCVGSAEYPGGAYHCDPIPHIVFGNNVRHPADRRDVAVVHDQEATG
jgi:hypothetical protein